MLGLHKEDELLSNNQRELSPLSSHRETQQQQ
jgi:hypothetical protein